MSQPAERTELIVADKPKVPRASQKLVTPLDMINTALSQGAGIEVLEKLMTLQERYEKNQARKAFDEAIAAAKAEIKPVSKNRKVDFTSQKGRTNYDYEDLGEIARSVDPILAKYGISYRHRSSQEGNRLSVTCILSHRDGHYEETSLTASNDESGNKNSIQAIGSAATYLQRYTLKLALGLAASKDDDGKAADPSALITDEQVDELIALADQVEADKGRFCAFFNIKSFADIPANKFEKAKAALLAKGKKQ